MSQVTGPANPFIVGQWVRGEEFYGRGELIGEILEGPRDGIWLLGARRVGKTSLLKQLEHLTARPGSGYFPLFWDLQGAESLAELALDFEDALLDVEPRLLELDVDLEVLRDRDLFACLGNLRRKLRSKRLKLLLLCDEVEELVRLGNREPDLLRKLQHTLRSAEGVRSVLASSVRLWALAEHQDDASPFLHGFLPPLYIPRLSADEARALIRQDQLPADARPGFEPHVVEAIRQRCDHQPQLIQLVAMRCLELGDLEAACEDVAADPTVGHLLAVDVDTFSGATAGRSPEELLPLVYDELRRAARGYLQHERPGHTLQATALVHEAYLKLIDQTRVSWQGRTHFFAVGARAMRRLLIDHARGHGRSKRGGDVKRVTLNEALTPFAGDGSLDYEQLLALDVALDKLRGLDPRRAHIVELRFFTGLTIAEVAGHLGLSRRTVNTEWSRARAWLEHELAV